MATDETTTTATGGSHVGARPLLLASRMNTANIKAQESHSAPSSRDTRKPGAAATRAPDLHKDTPIDASMPEMTGYGMKLTTLVSLNAPKAHKTPPHSRKINDDAATHVATKSRRVSAGTAA